MVSGHEGYIQLDFFRLLPGAAGGRALREQRGREHFRQLAERSAARPLHQRIASAKKGGHTRRQRLYHEPRTIVFIEIDEQVTQRVIPYWPHNATRRRKRPIYVRIEIARVPVEPPLDDALSRYLRERRVSFYNDAARAPLVSASAARLAHGSFPRRRVFRFLSPPSCREPEI